MKVYIYAIKDVKRGSFMNLWTEANDDTAMRNFDSIKRDRSTLIGMYPGDFELWNIGSFNDKSGALETTLYYVSGGAVVE